MDTLVDVLVDTWLNSHPLNIKDLFATHTNWYAHNFRGYSITVLKNGMNQSGVCDYPGS